MPQSTPHDLHWQEWIAIHIREIAIAAVALIMLAIVARFVEWPGASVITGRVTSGGKPVTFGTVTVLDANDRPHTATINADGTYVLRAIPPGPVRVAVSSPNPQSIIERSTGTGDTGQSPRAVGAGQRPSGQDAGGAAVPRSAANARRGPGKAGAPDEPPGVSIAAPRPATVPPPPAAGPAAHAAWFPIPGRYAHPAASGIRTSVGRGRVSLDLKLD